MRTIAASAIVGRPITQPQFDRRVSDGKIYIASGLTSNDIQLMTEDWRLLGPVKKIRQCDVV